MDKEKIETLMDIVTLVGLVFYLIIMFIYGLNKFTIIYMVLFLIWLFAQLTFPKKLESENKSEENDES